MTNNESMCVIEIKSTINNWESHCTCILPEREKKSYLRFIQQRKRKSYQGKCYKIIVRKLETQEAA